MLFLIIVAIIGFLWGLFNDGFYLGILGSLLGCIMGTILWLFIGGFIGCALPTVEIVEEQEICALNDSSTVEGESYLFSGYINEDLVCRYVTNTNKGKHIEEVYGNNVYIKEGDYKPTVKFHTLKFQKNWYYWFANDLFVGGHYIEFCVPENTVTNEYNIDLH